MRPALFFFVFLADRFHQLRTVDARALGINLPERRMVLDAFINPWLLNRGVIYLAVAVAPVTDDVHDYIAAEFSAVLRRELAYAHHRVRVFGIDVENRHGLSLREIRREARGMFLHWPRGEPDQVIHDNVNCPAH